MIVSTQHINCKTDMKLAELTLTGFIDKTAGSDPVPGGGSVAAMNGATAAALAEMVANLTIGRKKYEDRDEMMRAAAARAAAYREQFIHDIDADSDAYNLVFDAFKMPKESDEEKTARSAKIQEATKVAAEVPLGVARRACEMMEVIDTVARNGNRNAITDTGVAMMSARTAVMGAALNVKINLGSLKDETYVTAISAELERLVQDATAREQGLLTYINSQI